MRSLVIILVTLFVVSCDKADQGVHIPDVEVSIHDEEVTRTPTNLILYKGVPFSGVVVEQHDNGAIKSQSSHYLGDKHGLTETFYPNGAKHSHRTYEYGEKHGEHRGWYVDGQLKYHYKFENGLSIGTHHEWHKSGQLSKEFNYTNGQPLGTQKLWRSDGKLRSNYIIHENGRKYGLIGIKRCANVDIEEEKIDRITESTLK